MVEPAAYEPRVERLIREAQEAGKLDVTEGAGKPIASLSRPYDSTWWARNWIASERAREHAAEFSRMIEQALPRVLARPLVTDVRCGLEDLNRQIGEHNESDPAHPLPPLDVARLIAERVKRGGYK